MAQLMPLPLTVSCSSKIQIGFTFLVPAHPGCPGKEAVKWLFVWFVHATVLATAQSHAETLLRDEVTQQNHAIKSHVRYWSLTLGLHNMAITPIIFLF